MKKRVQGCVCKPLFPAIYYGAMATDITMNELAYTGCEVRGHVWIEGPEGTLLGIGRVELLEQVRACGSISAAAREMGMSYRHAWELIDSMNRQLGEPLVIKATGGRGGGGARLTAVGERAIIAFRELDNAFNRFVELRTRALLECVDSTTKREAP